MPVAKAKHSRKRLKELAEAALGILCRDGYERCQVADVARAMGVAVGTVYLYVESKEALFDLVVRYAAIPGDDWLDEIQTPVKTPPPGATLDFLKSGFGEQAEWPVLLAALEKKKPKDSVAELREVLAEQYELMRLHRRVLTLLTRSALEFPGLAQVFVTGLRDRLLRLLAALLEKRATAGLLRTAPDYAATAAVMVQSLVWANLQRYADPALAALQDETVEKATLDLLVQGMIASPDFGAASNEGKICHAPKSPEGRKRKGS